MSKDQGKFGMNNQESLGQGSFGGQQQNSQGESWVCPNCETVNTENTCILCGYQNNPSTANNDNSKKAKKLIVACGVFVLIVAMGFFMCFFAKNENKTISIDRDAQEKIVYRPKDNGTVAQTETVQDTEDTYNEIEPVPVSTYASDEWKSNIMASQDYGYSTLNMPAFGTEIPRDQVTSVTFLDSINNAPEKKWDLSEEKDGSVFCWAYNVGTPEDESYDFYIAANGGINGKNACRRLFFGFFNLKEINFNDCFHTEDATDMASMFDCCTMIKVLDLSSFETSNVTDMNNMFAGCLELESLNVSGFNTSAVTDMNNLFYNCNSLETLDLSNFNTTNVTNMFCMFTRCFKLKELDISSFITSKVTNMENMFAGCTALSNLEDMNFDISKVNKYDDFMDDGDTVNGRPWQELFE